MSAPLEKPRELDHRVGDGIEVTLLWWKNTGALKVVVDNALADERFELKAKPENALDVFKHPYAYRPDVEAAA